MEMGLLFTVLNVRFLLKFYGDDAMKVISRFWQFMKVAGLLVFFCWSGVSSAAVEPAQLLSFIDVWQSALQQTPAMLISRAQIAEAEGALQAARGQSLPKLQASYAGSGSDNGLNVFGMKLSQGTATFNDFGAGQFNPLDPASLFIPPENLNNPGWYRNYQSKLELQIPVFNGGKLRGYRDKAGAYLSAARRGDEMARQQLTLEVLKLYEGVQAAKAFVGVATKAVAAADAFAALTDKLYTRGVVSRSDLLRGQLYLSDVRLRQSEANAYLVKAYDQLRVLVGIPDDRRIEVVDTLNVNLPQGSLEELQRQMYADNPGLRAYAKKREAAQADVKIARADYLPHFNVVISRDWNSPDLELGGTSSDMIAGVLSWNLFDFGVRRGSVGQAAAQLTQQVAHYNQMRDQLRLQSAAAWQDVKLAAERVRVRELAISQAEEAERLERLRYEHGLVTMTELLAVQAELDKARGDLVTASYQQVLQRAGLLLALGQLSPSAISNKIDPQ
jgi:outer membrane protein